VNELTPSYWRAYEDLGLHCQCSPNMPSRKLTPD
jgi:hypothetical protein